MFERQRIFVRPRKLVGPLRGSAIACAALAAASGCASNAPLVDRPGAGAYYDEYLASGQAERNLADVEYPDAERVIVVTKTVPVPVNSEDFSRDVVLYDARPAETVRTRGVDRARVVHRRYDAASAEALDGACDAYVKIRQGETLSHVADYCDVSVSEIMLANPALRDASVVQAGDVIAVPASGRTELYELHAGSGVRDDASPRRAEEVAHGLYADRNGVFHASRSGETLYAIASRYDVSIRDVARRNPSVDPLNLPIGSRIYLPAHYATVSGHYYLND